MDTKFQVGSSSCQLTSKVLFPTPAEPSTLEVNPRPPVEPRETRLCADSGSFPGKPPSATPGSQTPVPGRSPSWRQGARERAGPSGPTRHRPCTAQPRPQPAFPRWGQAASGPAHGAGAVPRSLGGSRRSAPAAAKCSGVGRRSSASRCLGARSVGFCERP